MGLAIAEQQQAGLVNLAILHQTSLARLCYRLTAVTADLDNDGWPDIYMAADSTPSFFFHNRKDGTFREEAILRGIALSEDGLAQAGMGVAMGDFNLDGNLDILKTHFSDDSPSLYVNDGKGNFTEASLRAGLGVETRYVCWGAGMVDLDNNGWPDLFIVTGVSIPNWSVSCRRIRFERLASCSGTLAMDASRN